eukprot:CAMPEP_0118956654 /NCGR_PEP_ID=MMETSP1169-20130426/61694_1 /TAXON_ID=36882 /ORGANISM="Pyramimonas obovata, Strain CCMP722" /LENGTH=178 /DNA_ID=CAMNT_0006904697 /DNA_START=1615 /DNA_END=2151 /DNA_ORIENTATION=-
MSPHIDLNIDTTLLILDELVGVLLRSEPRDVWSASRSVIPITISTFACEPFPEPAVQAALQVHGLGANVARQNLVNGDQTAGRLPGGEVRGSLQRASCTASNRHARSIADERFCLLDEVRILLYGLDSLHRVEGLANQLLCRRSFDSLVERHALRTNWVERFILVIRPHIEENVTLFH